MEYELYEEKLEALRQHLIVLRDKAKDSFKDELIYNAALITIGHEWGFVPKGMKKINDDTYMFE